MVGCKGSVTRHTTCSRARCWLIWACTGLLFASFLETSVNVGCTMVCRELVHIVVCTCTYCACQCARTWCVCACIATICTYACVHDRCAHIVKHGTLLADHRHDLCLSCAYQARRFGVKSGFYHEEKQEVCRVIEGQTPNSDKLGFADTRRRCALLFVGILGREVFASLSPPSNSQQLTLTLTYPHVLTAHLLSSLFLPRTILSHRMMPIRTHIGARAYA